MFNKLPDPAVIHKQNGTKGFPVFPAQRPGRTEDKSPAGKYGTHQYLQMFFLDKVRLNRLHRAWPKGASIGGRQGHREDSDQKEQEKKS
jgi:hypothetical protein